MLPAGTKIKFTAEGRRPQWGRRMKLVVSGEAITDAPMQLDTILDEIRMECINHAMATADKVCFLGKVTITDFTICS